MEEKLEELEFEQPPEEEIESIPVTQRIFTDQADPEVESLYNKFKRGKLVLQPAFQRHFVWDASKSSRLIESAILEIPLPMIYLSEEKDGKEYVIDGQQRLTAFFAFIDGKFPDGRDFRLSGLRVFEDLNKSKFAEIPEDKQDKVKYCKIRTITFRKESNPELKFEIFKRLNTGAVSLNDQELRNCIFRGPYNKLLVKMAGDPDFMFLLGLKTHEKRMRDVELVLRACAFYHSTYLAYRSPMKRFLNAEMETYQEINADQSERVAKAFKNSVTIIRSLLGEHAFKRFYKGGDQNPNGHWEPTRFNASLFDILMWSFADADKNTIFQNLDSIREALIELMTTNEQFIDSIELSTSSVQAVQTRFDLWRRTLNDIIGIARQEPRVFSRKVKEDLYNRDPRCGICNQSIQDMDDTAVDHIKEYWRGGRTIPENARLAHRYCNWARARKEPS